MNILFIIDPIEKLHAETDTTLVIMKEAARRGHSVWMCRLEDLYIDGAQTRSQARARVRSFPDSRHTRDTALSTMQVICMRKDPPWNTDYLIATMILSLVDGKKTFILNNPEALRNFNEKLGIFNFRKFIPPSIVAKTYGLIDRFLAKHGTIVLKPLEGYGGSGIVVLHKKDKNKRSLIEMLTHRENRYIMAQKYLPEIKDGDLRVLVLNGKILGVQKRLAAADDHRSNISAGGSSHRGRLSVRQKAMCGEVARKLIKDGIYFAGLDIIGNNITEINITSPTGLVKINGHEKVKLEKKVVDFLEKRI